MMRTGKIKIRDKEYIICFSTRVLIALEEREGDSTKGLQRILSENKMADLFWLLEQMIDAGDRYAKLEGLENPGRLALDEIIDAVGVDEYETIFGSVATAVKAGNKATIELKQSKNAKTTQAE